LKFQVVFQGCEIDSGNWSQTRSRADMESTWRFPPESRRRQPGVHAILSTKGYTPWHHPQHGSHWLRLQPRGAWKYKTHDAQDIPQGDLFGWRMGLSMMNMDDFHPGGHDFHMRTIVEDHMSREDLGQDTSTQDWADLQNLGRELLRWEDVVDNPQTRNRWSRMPPREPDKKDQRPRPRGRKDKGKEISCFHGSTRVRMATTTWRCPEYKRMDELAKGVATWSRRYH